MRSILLLLVCLVIGPWSFAQEREHPRLDPNYGHLPGTWVIVKLPPLHKPAAPKEEYVPTAVKLLAHSTETILAGPKKIPVPAKWDLRRRGSISPEIAVPNPAYVARPEFQFAPVELTYYEGTELLGTLLLENDHIIDESGPDIREIRKSIQDRLDRENLWPFEKQQFTAFIFGPGNQVLTTAQVDLPPPPERISKTTRVEYRVLVPDPETRETARNDLGMDATRVESQIKQLWPAVDFGSDVLRTIVSKTVKTPQYWRIGHRGAIEKTP